MKRLTYLATALLVIAGAVSCKKNSDVQDPEIQPSGKMRTVTITAGQGATKTSVEGGKLKWSENDKLYIVPQGSTSFTPAEFSIKSGVGSETGVFEGQIDASITDETPVYAYAGGAWTYDAGKFLVDMSDKQVYVEGGLAENAFPSIGSGTIQNGITLNNPFGILRLNVKSEMSASGDYDKVQSITVTSKENGLSGRFNVIPDKWDVSGIDVYPYVSIACNSPVEVSSEGVPFNIVVPVGEYAAKDLTVSVYKNDGSSYNCTLCGIKVSANSVTAMDVQKPATKGTAIAIIDGVKVDVNWVQLWAGGPKWAVYNIGATDEYEFGDYFCWGGTYKNGDGIVWSDDHYNGASAIAYGDHDTAKQLWGSNWQMPYEYNFQDLNTYCTSEWSCINGNCGILYTGTQKGYTNNSVFFRAAGYCYNGKVTPGSPTGWYWNASPDGEKASSFYFYEGKETTISNERYKASPVRAILHE